MNPFPDGPPDHMTPAEQLAWLSWLLVKGVAESNENQAG